MSIINKPNTFSPNTSISSSQVNSNFDTLYNDYNGSISAANLANNAVTTAKISDGAVTAAKLASGLVDSGWVATLGTHSVATGYNSGNRSFEIDTSTDLSGIVSPGMRYKVDRSVAPPDQCADLEASSSQYASKSSPVGITFTGAFTCEAWIKLESYTNVTAAISRYNGTSGFIFGVRNDGRVWIYGDQGANRDEYYSYQTIPLGEWVHIAAYMPFNATSKIYINGVEVPVQTVSSSATALVQAGNLEVGSYNGGNFFDGKLADVRVWSDIRTATEIRDNMYAYPSDTTGLVAHFKLDGDFTDSSTNGNDLTAQNSAAATNADNPWNATEYGVITAVTSSTIQVFCPKGYGIPNETLTNPFYSTQNIPYGFPRNTDTEYDDISFFIDLDDTIPTASESTIELDPGSTIECSRPGLIPGTTYASFKAPVSGWYNFSLNAGFENTGASRTYVYLRKNTSTTGGSVIGFATSINTSAIYEANACVAITVYLNAGEYVNPSVYHDYGSDRNLYTSTFSGHLVKRVE